MMRKTPGLGAGREEGRGEPQGRSAVKAAGGPVQMAARPLGVGFALLCFYEFACFSGMLDWKISALHLPAVAYVLAIVAAAYGGRLLSVMQHRITVYLALLTGCIVVSSIFGFWRAGSLKMFTSEWLPSMGLYMVCAGNLATLKQCRGSLYAVAFAGVGAVLMTVARGDFGDGRLIVTASRYSNPNTLATTLLVAMPLLWLMGRCGGAARKALAAVLLVLLMAVLLLSGSRGGAIALVVVSTMVFLRSSMMGKLRIAIGVLVLGAGAALLLPHIVVARFATIIGAQHAVAGGARTEPEQTMEMAATGSVKSRLGLLREALNLTLKHPLLGIGPDQFPAYMAKQAELKQVHTGWLGTHDTYLQISSECGIPALCLYLAVIVGSLRELQRVHRRARQSGGAEGERTASLALALQTALVAFAACAIFDHMGYGQTVPLIAATVVAISRAAECELVVAGTAGPNTGRPTARAGAGKIAAS